MSTYVPTDWVDGATPLDEAHLDKIEQELVLLDGRKVPDPAGQDGKWLSVAGGAMVWAAAPAGGGGGLDWEGAWAGATPYVKGDVVTHLGVTYGAVNDSTGQTPPAAQAAPGALPVIPIVTSLPASPFDGQEVILVDVVGAATYTWRFRYVQARVTNKWVFVGGSALRSEVMSPEQTTTAFSAVDLATVGPGVTVPVAGLYRLRFNCRATNSGANFNVLYPKVGAAAAYEIVRSQQGSIHSFMAFSVDVTALAGDFVKIQYAVNAGTGYFMYRQLEVEPIAVGG